MKGKAGRVKGEAEEGMRSPTFNTVDNHRGLESPKGWATEDSHGAQRQEGYVTGNMAGDPGRVQDIRVQLDWTGYRAWGRVPGGLVPGHWREASEACFPPSMPLGFQETTITLTASSTSGTRGPGSSRPTRPSPLRAPTTGSSSRWGPMPFWPWPTPSTAHPRGCSPTCTCGWAAPSSSSSPSW